MNPITPFGKAMAGAAVALTAVASLATITTSTAGAATATTKKKTTATTKKKATTTTRVTATTKATATTAAAAAATTGQDTTPAIVAATDAFLATLDSTAKAKVLFADDSKKSDWSNLPDGLFKRDGLRMADMTKAQQTAALGIMKVLLSPTGYQTVVDITAGDGVLANSGGPSLDFGADHYWVRILGTPSTTKRWIFQYGGHHLALNATVVGGRVTLGPTLLAAQPSEYTLNGATVRPLKAETDPAYELVNSLTAAQKTKVVVATVGDLVLGAGADGKQVTAEGIPASELTASQKTALMGIIGTWVNTLNAEDAALKLAEAKATLDQTTFLWGGSTTLGQPAYYRIQGPKVYIEFSHQVGGGANAGGWTHIHAIYRDPSNDYGVAFPAA